MKQAIKDNKKIILISISIIVLLLIGIAFAYLVTTLYGEEEYIVRAGSLGLKLEESNELTLEKVIPIEDSEGMALEGFNFSLVNNGNIETDYTIYLDDIPLDAGETRMPDSAIRYSLTRNDEVLSTKNLTSMGANPNRRVDFGSIGVGETINYTLRIWIDYDATTEEASGKTFKGKLRVVASQSSGEVASEVLLANIPKGNQYDDGVDTFITGEDPNNYIWYSGKLWRAVSINNEEKTVKLVTQWNISTINYDDDSSAFEGSYVEEWLNDTSVDGFLGNLREPENFIVMDAKWHATEYSGKTENITRPDDTTLVTDAVGLLNLYEYYSSYYGLDYAFRNSYLNDGGYWLTLTPASLSQINIIQYAGNPIKSSFLSRSGIRPSINLKSSIKIVDGDGTIDNPYRLRGDNDTNLSGTLLNTRYSGEYIRFGTGENNLYRIVSHENRIGTKITSAEPLKDSGTFKRHAFGDTVYYSNENAIGTFLNGEYLTNYVGTEYSNMIEDKTTWYLGTVGDGGSYRLAKYKDINMSSYARTADAKVGLLRYGELTASQFNRNENNTFWWTLTPAGETVIYYLSDIGLVNAYGLNYLLGIKPSFNLKSNIVITGGLGTKEDPFTVELAT